MKKAKVKPFCESAKSVTRAESQFALRFTQETSLHGWKYLGLEKSNALKLLWTLVIASSFCISVYLMFYYSTQFLDATTVTSIQSTIVPVSVIMFKISNIVPMFLFDLRSINSLLK